MAEPLKIGDKVYLKSGSPPLVIGLITDEGNQCYVSWLDKKGIVQYGKYHRDLLTEEVTTPKPNLMETYRKETT